MIDQTNFKEATLGDKKRIPLFLVIIEIFRPLSGLGAASESNINTLESQS
jgi:hypothetical protein